MSKNIKQNNHKWNVVTVAGCISGALSMLVLSPQSAMAQGAQRPGVYLGAGYAAHEFEGENGVNASTNAFVARLGVQTNRWLSFEVESHFGVDDGDFDYEADESDFNLDDNSDGDLADIITAPGEFGLNYMVGAYARMSLPVSQTFDIAARLGYAYIDASSTVVTPGGSSLSAIDAENGPSYGLGGAWYFSDRSSLRVDYTLTDFDEAEGESWALAYQFKF